MKKTLKHLFSAAICAIMLFACVFPNFAAADTELSSVDAEKLEAFFAQSAGDGRHNFDHPDYAGGVYGSYTVSNFSESPCVGIEDGVIRWFDFNPDAMGFSPPLLRRFRFVRNIGNECLLPGAGSNAYYGGEP